MLSAPVDVTRLSPSVAQYLLRGSAPDGVADARLRIDEQGAGFVVSYEDKRPPTIVTFRARGALLGATLLLRDHRDELGDVAAELFAFGVETWLRELAEDPGRRYGLLALWVLAREAEKDTLAQDERHAATLERALEKHIRGLADEVAKVPREARKLDGSAPLWLDEALARYLEGLRTEEAKEAAQEWRESAHQAARRYQSNGDAIEWLRPWLAERPAGETGWEFVGALPAVQNLAQFVWFDEVRPTLEAPPPFRRFSVELVTENGDDYAKVTKAGASFSWAMGAPTERVVEIDQHRYAIAEGVHVRKLVPQSYALLPQTYAGQPHAMQLPLGFESEESAPLAVSVAHSVRRQLLSMAAAKIAVLALASPTVRAGIPSTATLRWLTEWIHPGATRYQARDFRATAKALVELRGLHAFLPDGRNVPVFEIATVPDPETAWAEMPVDIALGVLFRAYAVPKEPSPMRGEFLINLTATMALPNTEPALFRYALRFAAAWNAAANPAKGGEFDPNRMHGRTCEEWALLANALPPSAIERIKAKQGRRTLPKWERDELSKALGSVRKHFDELADRRMVKWHKRGAVWVPLPPEAYVEAWHQLRKGAGRRSE